MADILSVMANAVVFLIGRVTQNPGQPESTAFVMTQSFVLVAVCAVEVCLGLCIDQWIHRIPLGHIYKQLTRRVRRSSGGHIISYHIISCHVMSYHILYIVYHFISYVIRDP